MNASTACVGLGLALALGLAATAMAADTPPVDTSGATACNFGGYTTDKDPMGTNVRAAPRVDAPVIGRLPGPTPEEGADETFNPEFEVIGSRDGWILIKNAQLGIYGPGEPRTVFAGPGWISGKLTGTTINDGNMRDGPRANARVTHRLQNDEKGWGPDSYGVLQMHGCSGEFADVTVRGPDGAVLRGWVTKLCSLQVTTCP